MTADGPYPWSAGFRTLAKELSYRIEEVEGEIPRALRGTLFRNGSGRNELGGRWFPHWFDGDGMISAIRFDDAGIHYFNRYVRTDNYRDETRRPHRAPRVRQDAPGRRDRQSAAPAGKCVEYFGHRGRGTAAVAVGRWPTLCA